MNQSTVTAVITLQTFSTKNQGHYAIQLLKANQLLAVVGEHCIPKKTANSQLLQYQFTSFCQQPFDTKLLISSCRIQVLLAIQNYQYHFDIFIKRNKQLYFIETIDIDLQTELTKYLKSKTSHSKYQTIKNKSDKNQSISALWKEMIPQIKNKSMVLSKGVNHIVQFHLQFKDYYDEKILVESNSNKCTERSSQIDLLQIKNKQIKRTGSLDQPLHTNSPVTESLHVQKLQKESEQQIIMNRVQEINSEVDIESPLNKQQQYKEIRYSFGPIINSPGQSNEYARNQCAFVEKEKSHQQCNQQYVCDQIVDQPQRLPSFYVEKIQLSDNEEVQLAQQKKNYKIMLIIIIFIATMYFMMKNIFEQITYQKYKTTNKQNKKIKKNQKRYQKQEKQK